MAVALTAGLGEFAAGLRYQDIPREAVAFVHTGFADCIGVMIAGANEEAPQLLKAMLAPTGNEASVLFGQGRASALDAAWINGTAAHALDFDDVALRGHPSVTLVPAILAEAESIGASGAQMVTATPRATRSWRNSYVAMPTISREKAGIPPVCSGLSAPRRHAPHCAG